MDRWNLEETYETVAGSVAAGFAGQGPDLVLAHGWPWSSFSWHRVIPKLAKSFTVHWYDMPGYGRSEKSSHQRTSLDVQGEVFTEMMAHWGLSKPRVVAHDFGGATTLRAHLLHECEFEKYVLINVVAMRPWGSEFFDHMGQHVEAFQGLPQHIHKALVTAYIQGALANDIPEGDLGPLVAPWLTKDGRPSFYRQFAQADEKYTAEIESHFGEVRCPVKIIWGEDDPWIPLERGRALHRLMPEAEFTMISGAGHMPQLEKAAAVLQEVLDFLR
ncbi:alpha/beta fold hydrolase [Jannaschia donghaensis]|uniref:2-hydroxy-6-oxononadienedioate/2-hydroxy-6-oxononatrienedioate hydrolase n=1 Tax=Jannaschia donghaensis TaxID=420998 RepID=A0A0M6YNZ7_9RHOB|nr:alpha/beta hydrolase [Jannaschia donghaensis]CTQ51253.1 2-hydroxy-6-oxononadienedioate/2-hydroxy-6-oxononatrienedioate hydrolase [Jannaschia donghaensis]